MRNRRTQSKECYKSWEPSDSGTRIDKEIPEAEKHGDAEGSSKMVREREGEKSREPRAEIKRRPSPLRSDLD